MNQKPHTKRKNARRKRVAPLVLVQAGTMDEFVYILNEYNSKGFKLVPESMTHSYNEFFSNHTAMVFKPVRKKTSKKRTVPSKSQTFTVPHGLRGLAG